MSADLPAIAGIARKIAAYLQQHFPIQGQPPPALGSPGGPAHLHLNTLAQRLRLYLVQAGVEQAPLLLDLGGWASLTVTEVLQQLARARDELMQLFGWPEQQGQIATLVQTPVPEVDPTLVRRLESAADLIDQALADRDGKATNASKTAGETKPKRGRPPKDCTKQRADFAQKQITASKFGTWPECCADYQRDHPEDKDVTASILRNAYNRKYPAE